MWTQSRRHASVPLERVFLRRNARRHRDDKAMLFIWRSYSRRGKDVCFFRAQDEGVMINSNINLCESVPAAGFRRGDSRPI
jgi:hypothetical protein